MPYTAFDYQLISQAKELIQNASRDVAHSFIENLPDHLKTAKTFFSNYLAYMTLRSQFQKNENPALIQQLKDTNLEENLKNVLKLTEPDPELELKTYLNITYNLSCNFNQKSGELSLTGPSKTLASMEENFKLLDATQPKVFLARAEALFNENPGNKENNAVLAQSDNLVLQGQLASKYLSDYYSASTAAELKALKKAYGLSYDEAILFLQRGLENASPLASAYAADRTKEFLEGVPKLYDPTVSEAEKTRIRRMGGIALALCQDRELKNDLERAMLLNKQPLETNMEAARKTKAGALTKMKNYFSSIALSPQLATDLYENTKKQQAFNALTRALSKSLQNELENRDASDPRVKPLKEAISELARIRTSIHLSFKERIVAFNAAVKRLEEKSQTLETTHPVKQFVNWISKNVLGRIQFRAPSPMISTQGRKLATPLASKEQPESTLNLYEKEKVSQEKPAIPQKSEEPEVKEDQGTRPAV